MFKVWKVVSNMQDLVSVIILSYKNGDLLFESIDSVLKQDYPQIELLIAEDCAPDFDANRVYQYIETNKKANIVSFSVMVNNENLGTVKNINKALKVASGDFIKIIAGDDVFCSEDVFSAQVDYLKLHSDTMFVTGDMLECDEKLNPLYARGFEPDHKMELLSSSYDKLLKYICRIEPQLLATQAICFRMDFFKDHGFYDERLLLIEDLPMAIRMIQSGMRIGYINKCIFFHRNQTGVSSSKVAFDPARKKYYLDLKNYFEKILLPISDQVGKLFVYMRYKITCLRLEALDNDKNMLLLYIKYSIPLIYYFLSNTSRAIEYFLQLVKEGRNEK